MTSEISFWVVYGPADSDYVDEMISFCERAYANWFFMNPATGYGSVEDNIYNSDRVVALLSLRMDIDQLIKELRIARMYNKPIDLIVKEDDRSALEPTLKTL